MGRQPCCEKVGLKKGPWTAEEDRKLIHYITSNGHGCWRAVPKLAGLLRCGKSCRLRWTNYLRPDLKRGILSEEEEQLIIDLHAVMGNRWSRIAAQLPGRTDNEIKNYWNTRIKKKLRLMGIDPATHQPINTENNNNISNINSSKNNSSSSNSEETSSSAQHHQQQQPPENKCKIDQQQQHPHQNLAETMMSLLVEEMPCSRISSSSHAAEPLIASNSPSPVSSWQQLAMLLPPPAENSHAHQAEAQAQAQARLLKHETDSCEVLSTSTTTTGGACVKQEASSSSPSLWEIISGTGHCCFIEEESTSSHHQQQQSYFDRWSNVDVNPVNSSSSPSQDSSWPGLGVHQSFQADGSCCYPEELQRLAAILDDM